MGGLLRRKYFFTWIAAKCSYGVVLIKICGIVKCSYVFQAMRNHLFTLGAKIKLISRKQVPNEISKSSGLIWNDSKMI